MSNTRAELIADKLRREREELVDYSAIETRSAELGFPTSVRTLRFYVREGLLPSPRRLGRSAVFNARETLDRLLSIHMLQTCFGRALSEIKGILDRLRAEPAALADKCVRLHQETARPNRFQRVERDWLLDSFARSLTGDLDLYPRQKRFQAGPRQPQEILLSELFEDLELHSSWSPDASGQLQWTSPEEAIESTRATKGSGMPPASQHRTLSITPVEPPEGAVTPAVAREREEQFLHRFERSIHRVKRIFSPFEKKYHTVKSSQLNPEIDDPYQKVVEMLKEHRIYDRALLDSLPHDRATRYKFPVGGLLGRKKARVVVTAVVRSPLADLARLGGSLAPLGREEAFDTIRGELRDPGAYHVIGILSTVGWESAIFDRVPRGEDFSVVLIQPLSGGGWRLADSLPPKLTEIKPLFDPEEETEKVSRTFYRIMEDPELSIPGGHIEVDQLLMEAAVDREVLGRALTQVQQEDSRIRVTRVADREILKRDRY